VTFYNLIISIITQLFCNYHRQTQQDKAEREREEKRHREQAWKKKEKERISQGKRPFFLKKCKNLPSMLFFIEV